MSVMIVVLFFPITLHTLAINQTLSLKSEGTQARTFAASKRLRM